MTYAYGQWTDLLFLYGSQYGHFRELLIACHYFSYASSYAKIVHVSFIVDLMSGALLLVIFKYATFMIYLGAYLFFPFILYCV